MRYFNEQWDKLSRTSILATYCDWHVTDEANTYNEQLFEQGYEKMREEWEGMEENKVEQERFARQIFQGNLDYFNEIIPEPIKEQVVDMRVLALGTVTQQVLDEFEVYSEKPKRDMDKLRSEYDQHFQNAQQHMSKEALESIHRIFHDSFILDCGYQGADLFFTLRMDGGQERLEEQYTKLIFKDASVLEGEISKALEHWVCKEVYYENGQFEVHIRFYGGNIIIQATDIYSGYYHSFFASNTVLHEQANEEVVYGTVKDLIASGKIEREALLNHPLRESMEEEAFENMHILVAKDEDSFGKLAICQSLDKEEFSKLTGKQYIYEIQFRNDWEYNAEDKSKQWERGEELLQYIRDYCGYELELWSVWSDSVEAVITEEYLLAELTESNLEAIYAETAAGIDTSRRIVIKR